MNAAAEINRLHDEARRCAHASRESLQAALVAAWQAGQLLRDEKQRVRRAMGRGAWLLWLETNFSGTPRTAQRYMKLARTVGDVSLLRGLSLRQAYARLGIATEPKTSGKHSLTHRLPAHVVLANKLVVALRRQTTTATPEQTEAYRRDLRALYEQLHPWFESPSPNMTNLARRSRFANGLP